MGDKDMIWLRISLLSLTGYAILVSLSCVSVVIAAAKERIYYADLEHIEVPYYNTKYMAYVKPSSRRYSRRDPIYYVNLSYESLVPFGRNVLVDIYFYEFLSNEYRRSFVEAHFNVCDYVLKDKYFGGIVRNHFMGSTGVLTTCPFPKGVYHLANASVANMPILATFPFQKCRVYGNLTWLHTNGSKELMATGHLDVVIKSKWSQ